MQLSRQLLKQFANITNNRSNANTEATVYGTVISVDDSIGSNGLLSGTVQIDGSTVDTPVASTVKMAVGHRVIIRLKNHSATVTSNLNDPSASSMEHGLLVENCITFGNYDSVIYSLFSPTIDGDDWSREMRSTDKYRMDTKDGGESWNGPYQFRAVDGEDGYSTMYQYSSSPSGPWRNYQLATDMYRRTSLNGGETWGAVEVLTAEERTGALPSYIGETEITEATLRSPVIMAGTFYGNDFQVIAETSGEGGLSLYGYHGGMLYRFLRLYYWSDIAPIVHFAGHENAPELVFDGWSSINFTNYHEALMIHFGNTGNVSDTNGAVYVTFGRNSRVSFDGEVDLSGATSVNYGDNVPTTYAVFK